MGARGSAVLAVTICLAGSAKADVLHVDADATGATTGASWTDAFPSLQDALAAAEAGDALWVAEGRYLPDDGAGITPGDRDASFVLPSDVSLFGGFDGTELLFSDRAGLFDATVLDGDLLGDDQGTFAFTDDNSRHVVTCAVVGGARLDGFTVRGGDAGQESEGGGGLLSTAGELVVVDCRFEHNAGSWTGGGGGAAVLAGVATFERCTFHDNRSALLCNGSAGGGLVTIAPTLLRDCLFVSNRAACFEPTFSSASGGGVQSSLDLVAIGCTFDDNLAAASAPDGAFAEGGGLSASGSVHLIGCRFLGNGVDAGATLGGGVSFQGATATITNCEFSGNTLDSSLQTSGGGGLALRDTTASVVGCTFAGNVAASSFFFFAPQGGGLFASNGATSISSCVFWDNAITGFSAPPLEAQQIAGQLSLDHSIVEGLSGAFGGTGNLGADPLFVDADGPDDVAGTLDDDLRVEAGSPCIDAGDASALPDDASDVDGDGDVVEHTPWDIAGRERRHDDDATVDTGPGPAPVMDIGAHEFGAPFPTWANVGGALAGALGAPLLVGDGPLEANTDVVFTLSDAAPLSASFVVIGASALEVSLKGGLLVPTPTLVAGPVPTDASGAWSLTGRWPPGVPTGFELYAQVWIDDAGASAGFAATNAVRGTTP